MLGYEIRSPRAPKATISVTLDTTSASKTMTAGTTFTTRIDGIDYQFVTIADTTASNIGQHVVFDELEIYEGTYVTTKYTVNSSDIDHTQKQRTSLNSLQNQMFIICKR